MADLININITQDANGKYSATVAEFPGVRVDNASDLDELRQAMEIALAHETSDGETLRPVKLPPFVPGQVTRL